MPDRLRLGVLGLGAVAQAVHLPILDRLADRFEIAAVADLSPALSTAVGRALPRSRRTAGSRASTRCSAGSADRRPPDPELGVARRSHPGRSRARRCRVQREAAGLDARRGRCHRRPSGRRPSRQAPGRLHEAVRPGGRGRRCRRDRHGARGPGPLDRGRRPPPDQRAPAGARPPAATGEGLSPRARWPVSEPARIACSPRPSGRPARRSAGSTRTSCSGASCTTWRSSGPSSATRSAIDAVDVWPADQWPPSVGVTGRLPGDARFAVRWHFLPDYPAYREQVRVVTERATIELEFPTPVSPQRPDRPADRRAGGPGQTGHPRAIDGRGVRGGAARVPCPRGRRHAHRRPASWRAGPTSSRRSGSWPGMPQLAGIPIVTEAPA